MADDNKKANNLLGAGANFNREENKTEIDFDIGATVADQAQSHYIKKEVESNPPEDIEIDMDEDYSEDDYEEDESNQ